MGTPACDPAQRSNSKQLQSSSRLSVLENDSPDTEQMIDRCELLCSDVHVFRGQSIDNTCFLMLCDTPERMTQENALGTGSLDGAHCTSARECTTSPSSIVPRGSGNGVQARKCLESAQAAFPRSPLSSSSICARIRSTLASITWRQRSPEVGTSTWSPHA